ncbi:TRAP transporter small permease subunit [Magnetococcales bacterium HHB-1]
MWRGLIRLRDTLEILNRWMGKSISWLAIIMVLVTFVIVVLRYFFNIGWVALQESVVYMHALLFMLGAAYTLQEDKHVRVDLLYRQWSPRTKAWINLLGTLIFLFPLMIFILITSWPYVKDSWDIMEGSREAGGLDLVWALKSVLLLMPFLVLSQGLAWILSAWLYLAGKEQEIPFR